MKRVLVWGMTYNWGGIESVLYNYITNSDKNHIQFDVITTYSCIPRENELEENGCRTFHINNRKSNYLLYKKQLIGFMKKNAKLYDAVWLNDCMFANIDILKLAKKYGISKRIIHAHNANSLGGGKLRLIRHKINTQLLPLFATDFWACSQLAGEWSYTKKILNRKEYRVIPNAINCIEYVYNESIRTQYREQMKIAKDTFVVGHIGRFDYQKNHTYLLRIYKKLIAQLPNSVLLLVGTGTDLKKIKEEVSICGLDDRVMFLGQRNDISKLLQAMDIFVLPSKFEGLPVVLVEAMAAGLPCIISDKITKEAAIVQELSYFESIECDPIKWVDTILMVKSTFTRSDTYMKMSQAGYDIVKQARNIHELF